MLSLEPIYPWLEFKNKDFLHISFDRAVSCSPEQSTISASSFFFLVTMEGCRILLSIFQFIRQVSPFGSHWTFLCPEVGWTQNAKVVIYVHIFFFFFFFFFCHQVCWGDSSSKCLLRRPMAGQPNACRHTQTVT